MTKPLLKLQSQLQSQDFIRFCENLIIKIKMKLKPLESSLTNIRMGLDMVGKVYLSGREWTGKFAEQQYLHQYPKEDTKKTRFGKFISDNMARLKLNTAVCGLCLVQKNKTQMQRLCKCHHEYCYSCLNSYAITKIQDLMPVKCPQQECTQTMIMVSNVYRFIPDSVKLKYLNNKHTFSIGKDYYENRCQRCLDMKHTGQCKYALVPQTLEQSFQHRECPNCKIQIQLTQGRKKVKCPKCQQYVCYLCGVEWKANEKHVCEQKQKIRSLQKDHGYHGCCYCQCCSHGCDETCVGCGNCCCRTCGECCVTDLCCEVLFSCQNPNPFCFLWNIFSIPIRLLITSIILLFHLMFIFLGLVGIAMWIVVCFFASFIFALSQIICQSSCPLMLLLIILYPFVVIYSFGLALIQTSDMPKQVISALFLGGCQMLSVVWIELSPKKCEC